jgi:hypothetical protein
MGRTASNLAGEVGTRVIERGRRDGPKLNKAPGKADDLLYILKMRPKYNR